MSPGVLPHLGIARKFIIVRFLDYCVMHETNLAGIKLICNWKIRSYYGLTMGLQINICISKKKLLCSLQFVPIIVHKRQAIKFERKNAGDRPKNDVKF